MDHDPWYFVFMGLGFVLCFGPMLFCGVVLVWRFVRRRRKRKRRPVYSDD
jgi:hypothetical protein